MGTLWRGLVVPPLLLLMIWLSWLWVESLCFCSCESHHVTLFCVDPISVYVKFIRSNCLLLKTFANKLNSLCQTLCLHVIHSLEISADSQLINSAEGEGYYDLIRPFTMDLHSLWLTDCLSLGSTNSPADRRAKNIIPAQLIKWRNFHSAKLNSRGTTGGFRKFISRRFEWYVVLTDVTSGSDELMKFRTLSFSGNQVNRQRSFWEGRGLIL